MTKTRLLEDWPLLGLLSLILVRFPVSASRASHTRSRA